MFKTNRIVKISALLLALSAGTGISYYFYSRHVPTQQTDITPTAAIIDFDEARDTADILALFAKDRYWLVASEDYDPAYALSTRSPNAYEEKYKGKLTIKALRKGTEFIGFTAYYMKNFYEGYVLFLAVKDEYRGKGYGPQLMSYALTELKKMGAHIVNLVTRVSNLKAQSVYKKVGFTELARDENYVYFSKQL